MSARLHARSSVAKGPEQHHRPDQQPVEGQCARTAGDEADIGFAVIVVADDTAESEEEDRHGDEDTADGADFADQRGLRKPDARQRCVGDAAKKDDESRAGADYERIGEDPKGLDQPLA